MKWIVLLGLLLAGFSLKAQTVVSVPVISTNGGFAAYWYSPPYVFKTNWLYAGTVWIPEVSTDGAIWSALSEVVYLPPREIRALNQPCLTCLHFAEVSDMGHQVRIRLVSY